MTGIDDGNAQGEQEGQSDNNALEGTEELPVEAARDLDDYLRSKGLVP